MNDGTKGETIGFIGVGLMGAGMAANILSAGYPVNVLGNRNRKPVDDLVSRGAVEMQSAAEIAKASSVIFMCLPGSPQVEAVLNGTDGIFSALTEGTVIVDCSTADPNSTLRNAELAVAKGAHYVDAPLGRTPKEAWAGTLDTMVGADQAVFDRIKPLLDVWAGKVVHIGAVGDGHKMKLLNNFLSLGYGALYAEALALGAKVGISPQTFDSVIRGSRMDCGFYQTYMGHTIEGDRNSHQFTLTNALKDLGYLEAMADAAGLVNPVGNAAKNTFAAAVAGGANGPDDYVPHLPQHIGRLNGTDVPVSKPADGDE
ncbi:MAG: NAD(P)-dependent oxidoreductase [Pseudomonadota bacterium]